MVRVMWMLLCVSFLFCCVVHGDGGDEEQDDALEDPMLENAWHLHPTLSVTSGHLNVRDAWEGGVTGNGVLLGYTFRTPYLNHFELESQYDQTASALSDNDGDPPSQKKTSSISAAVGVANNGVCSRGVAYDAKFAIIGNNMENAKEMKWLLHKKSHDVDIFVVDYTGLDGNNTHCPQCWENIANTEGIVVLPTGMGGDYENCNYDMYTNAPFTITVAPHTEGGRPSTFAEPCAAALVSVPVGDSGNGTQNSSLGVVTAAKPPFECTMVTGGYLAPSMAAGVVALMYQASNYTLTTREIAHILVDTAHHSSQVDWKVNGVGYKIHSKLGLGSIDASRAVYAAAGIERWHQFREHEVIVKGKSYFKHPIMDLGWLVVAEHVDTDYNRRVDWVTVEADINHTAPSDLRIILVSPAGTRSELTGPRSARLPGKTLYVNVSQHTEMGTFTVRECSPRAEHYPVAMDFPVLLITNTNDCCEKHCTINMPSTVDNSRKMVLLLESTPNCFYEKQISMVLFKTKRHRPEFILIGNDYPILSYDPQFPVFSLPQTHFDIMKSHHDQGQLHPTFKFLNRFDKPQLSFRNWKFTTTMNWMERAQGTWLILVRDETEQDSGTIENFRLRLFTIETDLLGDVSTRK